MNKRVLGLAFAMLSFTLALPVWSQTAISSGQTIRALSGLQSSARYYRIYVPAGKSRLVVQTWGGSGNADLFVRYRYGMPSTSISTARSTVAGNNATITINNPAAGSWYISVRGAAAYSGVYLRATYSVIAPAIPGGITATQNLTQQVRVSWNTASRATSYEVWRRASTVATSTRIASTASTSFSDVSATAGVTYYYWVRARNSAGVSSFSARVTGRRVATLLSNGQTFGAFGGSQGSLRYFRLSVPAGQARLVVQTWGGSGDADLYVRYGALPSTTLFNGRSTSAGNNATVTLNNPAAGYWYVVVRGYIAYSGVYVRTTYSANMNSISTMVLIPGGTNSGTDPDSNSYSLTVESFYMDKYEVTKALWDEVYTWAIANGYSFDNAGWGKAAHHPFHSMNWYNCVKWCNARSQKERRTPCYTVGGATYKTGQFSPDCNFSANGYRLPTSTEWEYAARGGLRDRRFPWGNMITHSQANYRSNEYCSYDISATRGDHPTFAALGIPFTNPVGAFAPNEYGLYDMVGNVGEWCNDASSGTLRAIRNGSCIDEARSVRCISSSRGAAFYVYYLVGFRVVCR